jgi:predicted ribosomally synthesized peptide with SipW-like signal peptide
MADFVAVLKKTLDGLSDTTPQTREKVYEKARVTIAGKLTAMNPPLPDAVVTRQKQALEEAIIQVEAEINRKNADPLSELESVFASLKNPDPRAVLKEPAKVPAPSVEKPSVAAAAVERPVPTERPVTTERPVATERPVVVERPLAAAKPAPVAPPPPAAPYVTPAAASPLTPAAPYVKPADAALPQPATVPVDKQAPAAELSEEETLAESDDELSYRPETSNRELIAADDEVAPRRRGGYGRLVAAAILLALVGGGAYAYWAERDQVESLVARAKATGEELWTSMTGSSTSPNEEPSASTDVDSAPPQAPAIADEPAKVEEPAVPAPAAGDAADNGPDKFTQRLTAEGAEVDAGPAGGAPIIGEGTSVAAATQPSLPGAGSATAPAMQRPDSADQPSDTNMQTSDQAAAADGAAAAPGPLDQPAGNTPPADAVTTPSAAGAAPPADPAVTPPAGVTAVTPPADGAVAPPADIAAETPPMDATQPAAPPLDATQPATPPAPDDAAATPQAAGAVDAPAPTATQPDATAQATQAPNSASPADQQKSIPVGQRAIFYEERTNVSDASAEPGSIVWSLVQESPGNDLPPEAAVRAEVTIPGKDVQLRMTIRRNADKTLPASHIVEMIFLTPQGFEGGGIDNVLRMSMKGSEQEAGSPLLGIPAKIADGFFLIALNDSKPDADANTSLLRRQLWIDVPVQYKSGRRALFTMEKGIPGAKVIDEALKAWEANTSG